MRIFSRILCGVGLPWPRDQNQREANAAFLIDSDYDEESTWRYRSGPLTKGVPCAPGDS